MRKALKILIPILLVLVILLIAYWFFFQFRSDITANVFTGWGDSRMNAADYNGAVRYYGYANRLNPNDTALSIKLAEAYRLSGNYTKTEYTLVQAISVDAENPELYLALSGAYVEQDKLLDAQQMLDHINNEAVRATLDALRPAPPQITPEGGKYSDYISISATCDEGATCYVTTNGEFPSLLSPAYSEPIVLPGGETTVCAIAIGENGLVSTAVYAGYTIAGIVEDVTFADRTLEAYVQEQLNKTGRTLKTNDLWSMTELVVPEDVTELSDLSYFTGLESLTVNNYAGEDYSFLKAMPRLTSLNLSGCSLSSESLDTISGCLKLESLNLTNCGISNISALSALSNLKVLLLDDNSINDLTAVGKLPSLEELSLCRNAVTSLTAIGELKTLRILDVSYNSIETIAPIAKCTTLSELNVSDNKLTDIKAITSLVNLTSLKAAKNSIEDVSGIEKCTKLEVFDLSNNKLVEIDGLANITTLTDINIDYNDVVEVPAFVSDCGLVNFSAAHNFLEDCEGLGGLESLNYVNMDYNNIRDISCLLDCNNLVQVNVFGTYIKDAGDFSDHGIIVNYDPT